MRLDCYHFFNKVWYDKITINVNENSILNNILNNIKDWVMSWFKTLETHGELLLSRRHLEKYMSRHESLIGNGRIDKIAKLIQAIITHQNSLLHLHFKEVCTFDFIGDSIVEGANSHLKKGTVKVSNSMNISNSGITQLKATEEKYHKKNMASASKINSKKTWSKSLTKDYLTTYAEGLSCTNFDRRKIDGTTFIGNLKNGSINFFVQSKVRYFLNKIYVKFFLKIFFQSYYIDPSQNKNTTKLLIFFPK